MADKENELRLELYSTEALEAPKRGMLSFTGGSRDAPAAKHTPMGGASVLINTRHPVFQSGQSLRRWFPLKDSEIEVELIIFVEGFAKGAWIDIG
jgi:hypothetical protein